jgi:hypothetical protein
MSSARSASGIGVKSIAVSASFALGAIICTGFPSTATKRVRSTSCRRTISSRLASSAARFNAPRSRIAVGRLYVAVPGVN